MLESMNPDRRATLMSVAAHSLYEQADPNEIVEPEGIANVSVAQCEAVDERRTRVSGAVVHSALFSTERKKPPGKIDLIAV